LRAMLDPNMDPDISCGFQVSTQRVLVLMARPILALRHLAFGPQFHHELCKEAIIVFWRQYTYEASDKLADETLKQWKITSTAGSLDM
jgi:hypothetical protein